jgi:extracellular elastinolytic metalloproteinase
MSAHSKTCKRTHRMKSTGHRASRQPAARRLTFRQPRVEHLEERMLLSISNLVYVPTPHDLYVADSTLSGPAAGQPLDVAMRYLTANAPQLGLTADDVQGAVVTDQYADADTGVTHLYLRQTLNDLQVVNANMNVNVLRDGSILSVNSTFVPELQAATSATSGPLTVHSLATTPTLTAAAAVQRAADYVGLAYTSPPLVSSIQAAMPDIGIGPSAVLSSKQLSLDPIPAKLYYVATSDGARLAWDVVLRTPDKEHWYDVSIDGQTGQSLLLSDWVDHAS